MSPIGVALSMLIGISLGFFGGGGSILTVPLLIYVFGLEAKTAIASSLLIVALASVAGAFHHWRAGNIHLRTGIVFGTAGMAGAYLGGRAGAYIDGTLLLLLFAAMMILTSIAMWRGRSDLQQPVSCERAITPLLLQGFGVGIFTGLIGAGGGFLIVPALTLWAGLAMPVAVGTSLLIIVMKSAAGFAGYLNHVQVDVFLIGVVAAAAISGSFIGSRLVRRVDPASLHRAFAGFVAVMATVILAREADAWLGTARAALPISGPQIVFSLVVLGIGIATGRVSRRAGFDPMADRVFVDGAGI